MKSDPSVPKTTTIKISAIVVDMDIQPRANGLRQDHVDEIKAAYLAGEAVDPPVVWNVGKVFKLSQGFHRIEAAKRAGLKELACIVMTGTAAKCLIDAACSNQKHGLKRTNEDKRRCVGILLDALPSLSDRSVAEMAGVGHQVVAAVRAEKHPPDSPQVGESSTYPPTPRTDNDGAAGTPVLGDSSNTAPAKRVGKDGRSYNAAKPKPAPAAEVAAEPDATPEPVKLPDAATTPAEQPSTGDTADEVEEAPVVVEAEAAPAEPAKPVTPPKADPLHHLIDGLNNSIPRGLQDTWGDPALRNVVERIRAAHKELVSAANHVKNTLMPKGQYWPFASCPHAFDSLMNAADDAARAMSQVEAGLPFCVCLKCKGDGCQHCRQGGYLPKWKYENRETYGV